MIPAGLEELDTYISWRHNMVYLYIATRPIMDLFLEAEKRLGARVEKRWWYQEGMYFEGTRVDTEAGVTVDVDG